MLETKFFFFVWIFTKYNILPLSNDNSYLVIKIKVSEYQQNFVDADTTDSIGTALLALIGARDHPSRDGSGRSVCEWDRDMRGY